MGENRGSIVFFGSHRPPTPLDIFSCPADPPPSSPDDEHLLTDGVSNNLNGRPIPAAALEELLNFFGKSNPKLFAECGATPLDAQKGRVTGLVFVSERDKGLETLHVALRFTDDDKVKVLSLADIYGADTFGGARLEDSGCIAGGFKVGAHTVGHSLVYVSTKEPVKKIHTPWTVVYSTNLADGQTERLTPPDEYDLSPAVSPSGKMVAVANFQWYRRIGGIEHLNTNIVIMNVDMQAQGRLRRTIIKDGGWPTWGSDNIIFFHRANEMKLSSGMVQMNWSVFRYDITTNVTVQVTPEAFDAMTPAAISETKVVVATYRKKSLHTIMTAKNFDAQRRHIEIFDMGTPDQPVLISQKTRPIHDHWNPFVVNGGSHIGYNRCRTDRQHGYRTTHVQRSFDKMESPHTDVGLFRQLGLLPTVSNDGSKLACVGDSSKKVWLIDSHGTRVVYEKRDRNRIFFMAWNQNPEKDTLYVCIGSSFATTAPLEIYAISNLSGPRTRCIVIRLTTGKFNNAFPSSNPEGTKFVFRSTRGWEREKHSNLYIMEDLDLGEFGEGTVTRLTNGPWTDTHCSWSPQGDWIVFSSMREQQASTPEKAFPDAGFSTMYLVSASDPTVVVRVLESSATLTGYVSNPMFSPDMKSIVFASDHTAVSNDPISMPIFQHSMRRYGNIISIDLRDTYDITKNKDIVEWHRTTHSRFGCFMPAWVKFTTAHPNQLWFRHGHTTTCKCIKPNFIT